MMSTFYIDMPSWINYMNRPVELKVIADLLPIEPDVGIMGNGKQAVELLSVYCDEKGYDPQEDILECFSTERQDDIAQLIYRQLEENDDEER